MVSAGEIETYSAKINLAFERPVPQVQTVIAELLQCIGSGCIAAGASLIGHIKCYGEVATGPDTSFHRKDTFQTGSIGAGPDTSFHRKDTSHTGSIGAGPYLHCSLTSLRSGVSCRGSAIGPCESIDLDLNVLVYGLPHHVIDATVKSSLQALSEATRMAFKVETNEAHPHHPH